MAKRVILLASGGGHTGHAIALGQRLKGKAEMLFIVPKGDKWSAKKASKLGKVIEITKARGPKDPYYKYLPKFIWAYFESLWKILVIHRDYDVIVSGGSNHSVPPSLIGKLKGMKLINIESSVRFIMPSGTAKLLERYADITALQWPEQKRILPKGEYFGPLVEYPEYLIENKGYILVTGGTYGHKLLFDTLAKTKLSNVVLQTGRIPTNVYKKKHPEWIIFNFDPNFGKWLAGAEVVVTHLGKTAIDAALAYRKPLVIVPNPEWTRTASFKDAEILAKKLNAVLVNKLKPNTLIKSIEEAKSRKPPGYPDGAQKLAERILKL